MCSKYITNLFRFFVLSCDSDLRNRWFYLKRCIVPLAEYQIKAVLFASIHCINVTFATFYFFCMKCNHVVYWTMSIEPLLFLHCNVVNLSIKLSPLKSTHHCSYLKISIFHLLWFWWKILDFKIECLDILTYYENRQNV